MQVRTFDVANQVEGPHWTLHQWNLYWESRRPFNKVGGHADNTATFLQLLEYGLCRSAPLP